MERNGFEDFKEQNPETNCEPNEYIAITYGYRGTQNPNRSCERCKHSCENKAKHRFYSKQEEMPACKAIDDEEQHFITLKSMTCTKFGIHVGCYGTCNLFAAKPRYDDFSADWNSILPPVATHTEGDGVDDSDESFSDADTKGDDAVYSEA